MQSVHRWEERDHGVLGQVAVSLVLPKLVNGTRQFPELAICRLLDRDPFRSKKEVRIKLCESAAHLECRAVLVNLARCYQFVVSRTRLFSCKQIGWDAAE